MRSFGEQCRPVLFCRFTREEQFEAVLTGVARARDGEWGGGVRVGGDLISSGECGRFNVEVMRERFGGGRSLQCERGGGVALVFEGDVAVETVLVGGDPVPIFVDASGVHDEEKRFWIRLISDEIVDDAAGGVGEQGVLTFARGEFAEVVGEEGVEEAFCIFSGHAELAHVGDVKEPAAGANGFVFCEDARVLDGHEPSAETDEFCPVARMDMGEGGGAEVG